MFIFLTVFFPLLFEGLHGTDPPEMGSCFPQNNSGSCEIEYFAQGTFTFGQPHENVVSFKEEKRSIIVGCKARYKTLMYLDVPDYTDPDSQYPPLKITPIVNDTKTGDFYERAVILNATASILQALEYPLEGIIRCEHEDNPKLATEFFINHFSEKDGNNSAVFRVDRNDTVEKNRNPLQDLMVVQLLVKDSQIIIPCRSRKYYTELWKFRKYQTFDQEDFQYYEYILSNKTITEPVDETKFYDPRVGQQIMIPETSGTLDQFLAASKIEYGNITFRKVDIGSNKLEMTSTVSSNKRLTVKCSSNTTGTMGMMWARCPIHLNTLLNCEMALPRNLDVGIGQLKPLKYYKKIEKDKNEITITKKDDDFITGAVSCFQESEPDANGTSSIKFETIHFFTGVDYQIYLAPPDIKGTIPPEWDSSLMTIIENGEGKVECAISSFLLQPKFQMSFEYNDGRTIKFNTSETEKITETGARVALAVDVKKEEGTASCSVPYRYSNRTHTKKKRVYEKSPITLVVLAACLAIAALMAALIVAIIKYRQAKGRIIRLSPSEEQGFFDGDGTTKELDGAADASNLPFHRDKIISRADVEIFMDKILGKGHFGETMRGNLLGNPVAVKTHKRGDINTFMAFLTELKILAYIGEHEYVIQFFGAVVDNIKQGECYAVFELSPFGDLLKYLLDRRAKFSPTYMIKKPSEMDMTDDDHLTTLDLIGFCYQIAAGMEFLEQKNVFHGDLAARNVLVFPNKVVKVTDFGLSKKLYEKIYVKKPDKKAKLPWRWTAIECFQTGQYSSKSDVWSFGVTAWEIFSLGEIPFKALQYDTTFVQLIETGLRLSKPKHTPLRVFQMLSNCWHIDPEDRPNFSNLRQYFNVIYNRTVNQFSPAVEKNIYSDILNAAKQIDSGESGSLKLSPKQNKKGEKVNGRASVDENRGTSVLVPEKRSPSLGGLRQRNVDEP